MEGNTSFSTINNCSSISYTVHNSMIMDMCRSHPFQVEVARIHNVMHSTTTVRGHQKLVRGHKRPQGPHLAIPANVTNQTLPLRVYPQKELLVNPAECEGLECKIHECTPRT